MTAAGDGDRLDARIDSWSQATLDSSNAAAATSSTSNRPEGVSEAERRARAALTRLGEPGD
ncbi:hypothetical protein [Actinopolymorpha pittospori]|uniref:Uncharacterized protein n=1 Tax=Actinopolymorpha pittospori TaxID=648752 RepID=A0A927N6S5_9ACTN|nr:hypothetical protein [Actinopolymorpha pittospori]MBE1611293.1 hypothetical protein [Actinopolymorpha pittospori]